MKAFLVCGAQRSGTRMLTHTIAAAGAVYLPLNMRKGDPHQELEQSMARKSDLQPDENVVLHFSLPKQGRWPDLERFRDQLEKRDYAVRVVAIMRDWHANISSMMAPHFIENRIEGERQIRSAWRYLFYAFPDDLFIITYEAFVGYAEVRQQVLVKDLGLPMSPERLTFKEVKSEFKNENPKWY